MECVRTKRLQVYCIRIQKSLTCYNLSCFVKKFAHKKAFETKLRLVEKIYLIAVNIQNIFRPSGLNRRGNFITAHIIISKKSSLIARNCFCHLK